MDYFKDAKIENAKREDIDELAKLLYKTEDYPEGEWGSGEKEELLERLKSVMEIEGTRFYYGNFRVLKSRGKILGISLGIGGKNLKKSTFKADKYLIGMQEGIKEKFRFLILTIGYLLDLECLFNEYYLSNIILKKEFRGKGYSEILMEDVVDNCKAEGYKKISLRANNENLVKYYASIGYSRVSKKSKKMIMNI